MALRTPLETALKTSMASICSNSQLCSMFRNQGQTGALNLKRNLMTAPAPELHLQELTYPPVHQSNLNVPSDNSFLHQGTSSSIRKQLHESDLNNLAKTICSGAGYAIVRSVYSEEDTDNALNIIQREMKLNKNEVRTTYNDIKQNHYSGLLYGLLSHGDIFQKFVANETILQISNRILGDRSRLSSVSANTIYRGMEKQNPHTDYPYHRTLWPKENVKHSALPIMMSLTFISALSDLTPDNGSTALVPFSQLNFDYPDDPYEFERKAIQINARKGDMCVIAGSLQHCAMENNTAMPRSAIIQQMVSLFVNPFEDFRDFYNFVPVDDKVWRQLFALDHPLPKNQIDRSTSYQL